MTREELMKLFEAARWSPSAYNNQPWYFVYSFKNGKGWDNLFNLLVDFNKDWCKNASVLILIISDTLFEHDNKSNVTHSFDTGSAWQSLALQASLMGLIAHGMSGFDYKKAQEVFKIPKRYQIEAMIAIGKQGNIENMPEHIQKMEKPSIRKSVSEFVFENEFSKK